MIDFRIKICGITNANDALKAFEFGADAIGLNFYPKSLRSVTIAKAKELVTQIPGAMVKVGVFVNQTADSINEICAECGLNYVQLHGDESPDLLNKLDTKSIRATRISNYESITSEINPWVDSGVSAILLDSHSGRQYGGTGKPLDWNQIAEIKLEVPLILAGGLNCDNVSQAISIVRPDAVDIASGIEKFPGSKDHDQMRAFIFSANGGFRH